jgi:hypothetical protein
MQLLDQNPIGLVCPYCGLLFFTLADGVLFHCPGCARRWKPRSDEMLTARLGEQ